MTKTKEMLVDSLARKAGITKIDAGQMVEILLDIITQSVKSGDKVHIAGFGTFEAKVRAPRVARNPRTNEQMDLPAKRVPIFKPGKAFKDSVSQAGSW